MAVYDSVVDTVGRTPLVALARISKDCGGRVLGKLENRNPAGSLKDRAAVSMIRAAEKAGELEPGATIVEATSGNTGIGLAFAAAALGYRLIITMPENMSRERVALLRLLGAEVVLTRGGMMRSAVDRAAKIARDTDGAVTLDQFRNPANPAAHREGTGPEIWVDTGGDIDAFVAGVGTGGTITGAGGYLKEQKPSIKVVAVEPKESAVLSGERPGPHGIQGIGAGFVPDNLDRDVIDEVATVTEQTALDTARKLARLEGLLVGISSGASVAVALELARRPAFEGKTIVAVVCDTGERYMSTALADVGK